MTAVLIGMSGVASGHRPSPSQDEPGPNQEAEYVGAHADPASVTIQDDGDKAEDFGPVGSAEGHGPDTADAAGAAEDSAESLPDPTVPTERIGASDADLQAAVADGATTRVIVMTKTPTRLEANLSAAATEDQRDAIAEDLAALEASLAGTGATKVSQLEIIPAAVYEVDAAGMAALLANPAVASISLDLQVEAQLDSSTGVIDSDLLNAAGVLGDGFDGSAVPRYEVGIIDSGVDNQHNAFTGRIVAQACFVDDNSCPNGANAQIGGNAGDNCTHSTDCDHGTHVGGIASGAAYDDEHEGVGRGTGIVAINVATNSATSTRWTASFSDIDQALQHVFNLKNGGTRPNIVAVNLSIGTSTTFSDPCNVVPATNALFGQLRGINIAPVVAAGNNGSSTQMSAPGCESNALAIGATTDADVPASFTNSSPGLEWWAPGVDIEAAVPSGTSSGFKNGTSMASPHVAGSFGLLSECVDGNGTPLTLNAKIGRLNATGVNVTRNGVTRRRINVLDAATGTVNNNDFASPEVLPAGGNFNDFDFTVCSDTEPGEPGPFSLDNGIWYSWTPSATGTVVISTDDGGGNVTTFDTTLAVYTGNSLGSLTTIASDDDSGVGLRSLVNVGVNAGTTYRIKVDGFGAANGLLNLHLGTVTPVLCGGAPATIVGNAISETINGTAGNDVIAAGAGNDTVNGGGGNDRICAGDGNDVLEGAAGDDDLRGEGGTDTASYWTSPSAVNVNLFANSSVGGAGSDSFSLVENLLGSAFNDKLVGDFGPNRLQGGPGKDTIHGSLGNDIVDGGSGNDRLYGRQDNDSIVGGSGIDTVIYTFAPGPMNVNLATGTATGEGNDTISSTENVWGSSHGDTLLATGGTNQVRGGGGNDVLRGGAGNDVVRGDGGNDDINGQAGNDNLRGDKGNDALAGAAGTDTCNGGRGVDSAAASCETILGIP